jgi:hypothetical protein
MDKIRYIHNGEVCYEIVEEIKKGFSPTGNRGVKIKIDFIGNGKDRFDDMLKDEEVECKYATLVLGKVKGDNSGYVNLNGIEFSLDKDDVLVDDEYYFKSITPMGDTEIAAINVEDILGVDY